jgi:molybdopterin molybdotransferase
MIEKTIFKVKQVKPMLTVNQAESLILDIISPLDQTEICPLENVFNRVLAESVSSDLDFPYWDNSAMDGYAVKFEDVQGATPDQPVVLTVIEEIPAGRKPQLTLRSQQAARIFTGAMLPAGADTVVMQENTQAQGDRVSILIAPSNPQMFVRKKGEYAEAGKILLAKGTMIKEPEMAILATAQKNEVTVYRRPLVAIFSTGDELISPDQTLEPGQIIDSNQFALASFLQGQGAMTLNLGIVADDRDRLRETMSQAINEADMVLSTGGVSVGDYDYVEELLKELGGEILIQSVAIKPGKPLTVAKFDNGCIYFGIPGNPVSALVSCWRFVQPALKKLSGLTHPWRPSFIKARTNNSLKPDSKRETYLWGKVNWDDLGNAQFQVASGSHSSGNLINLAQTNCLAYLPPREQIIDIEQAILVMLIG